MAAVASDWLRHFRLVLLNCWTGFDETWQEARSQHPLPSLCFSGRSVKKRWPPWPMIDWDIFDFSSETAERDSKKFDRKRDLNIFYTKFCFSVWWVNKNYRPGRSVKKVAHCTQVHDMWSFGPLVYVFIHVKEGGGGALMHVYVRLGYCFTPYQRLWLCNGAPLVAFYDTLGIRRTHSRLKPPASSRGACICIGTQSQPLLKNCLMDVYET